MRRRSRPRRPPCPAVDARRPFSLTHAADVSLAACGRGGDVATAPAGTPTFDAAAVARASGTAQVVLAQPVLAAIIAPLGTRPVVSLDAPAPTPGATYVRDAAGYWVRDAARTGAPANGVRYVVASPAGTALGSVDVVDTTAGAQRVRRLTVSDGSAVVYTSTRTNGFLTAPLAPVTLSDLAGTATGGGQSVTFRSTISRDTTASALSGALAVAFGSALGSSLGAGFGGRPLSSVSASTAAGASFETTAALPLRASDVTRTAVTVNGHALVLTRASVPYQGPIALPVSLGTFYVPGDTVRVT